MATIYIGLPKTGTTYLQYRVLAETAGLAYIHRAQGRGPRRLCHALRHFAHMPGTPAYLLRLYVSGALRRLSPSPNPVLVSDENIAIHPQDFWRGAGTSPSRLAHRLCRLSRGLPEPLRIVIGIRRQDRWLASRYAQSSMTMPELDQNDFDLRMARIADDVDLAGPLAWLDYDLVMRTFVSALGPDRIHILPLERLITDPDVTLDSLGEFIGTGPLHVPRSVTPSPKHAPNINRRARGGNRWKMARGKPALELVVPLQDRIIARFAASNASLAARMSLGF